MAVYASQKFQRRSHISLKILTSDIASPCRSFGVTTRAISDFNPILTADKLVLALKSRPATDLVNLPQFVVFSSFIDV
jgi:hypothetical protein